MQCYVISARNLSCIECMDKYQNCIKRNNEYNAKVNKLTAEIDQLQEEIDKHQAKIAKHKSVDNALDQCKNSRESLSKDLKKCQDKGEQLKKIEELEHALGECNVEWGACQQESRQKDALDRKRIEAIQDQKDKFDLCNQQLKEYKQKAKANRR